MAKDSFGTMFSGTLGLLCGVAAFVVGIAAVFFVGCFLLCAGLGSGSPNRSRQPIESHQEEEIPTGPKSNPFMGK